MSTITQEFLNEYFTGVNILYYVYVSLYAIITMIIMMGSRTETNESRLASYSSKYRKDAITANLYSILFSHIIFISIIGLIILSYNWVFTLYLGSKHWTIIPAHIIHVVPILILTIWGMAESRDECGIFNIKQSLHQSLFRRFKYDTGLNNLRKMQQKHLKNE